MDNFRNLTMATVLALVTCSTLLVGALQTYVVAKRPPELVIPLAPQVLEAWPHTWDTDVFPSYPVEVVPTTRWIDASLRTLRTFKSYFGITRANAAAHPIAGKDEVETFAFTQKGNTLKHWSVNQESTPTKHVGCFASREFGNGVGVTVYSPARGSITLMLRGVSFALEEPMAYAHAVVSIDDEPAIETIAARVSKWQTSLDLSSLTLTQIANGKTIRITVNGRFFEFSLAESAKAARAVAECNEKGQYHTIRRTMQAAVPAETR